MLDHLPNPLRDADPGEQLRSLGDLVIPPEGIGIGKVAQYFSDEKRVAARLLVKDCRKVDGDRLDGFFDQHPDCVLGKPCERDTLVQVLSVQVDQRLGEILRAMQLCVAEAPEDEQRGGIRIARNVAQQPQA